MSAPPGPTPDTRTEIQPDPRPDPQKDTPRLFSLAAYFQARLGAPARKVPLDAGFSCPNRDGTLKQADGSTGCVFCNPAGSGTGLFAQGHTLAGQWALLAPRLAARHPEALLLAYLQAYTNTHASLDRLQSVLAEISGLPGVAGLCLGTRPDCLDVGLDVDGTYARLDALASLVKTDALASLLNKDATASPINNDTLGSSSRNAVAAGAGLSFVQLDLGLQSADDAVLSLIGRGHDAACFARAARAAADRGLAVCAHLVHGLPGAGPDDLARSVDFLNELPVAGVKFHNLLVCRGARLAALWRAGAYVLPGRVDYVAAVVRALTLLRPDICVQRLASDPVPGELIAPDWGADKEGTLRRIRAELVRQNTWQGREGYCPDKLPQWGRPPQQGADKKDRP